MKFLSWLPTCNNNKNITLTNSPSQSQTPSFKHYISTPSSITLSPSLSDQTTNSSLQSNLSLQTLPSVPSLQYLSPDSLNLAITHQCIATLSPKNPISCVAVHGKFLYAACSYEINVYERTSFLHVDVFNGQDPSSGAVKSITFSKGKVFTGHQDCKIRVWQITAFNKHKLLATLPTVNDYLRRFVLPKNYVTVRRHKKRLWIEHNDAVSGLAANDGMIYSVSWDRSLKIWNAKNHSCVASVKVHDDAVNAVVVSGDGTVYTGSADRMIRVWAKGEKEKRHRLVATLEKHKSAVNALALNEDGSVLFSGACDRSILVWEREDSANYMAVSGALRGHDKAILCLINVHDLLLSGSADQTVRIWRRGFDEKYCCLGVLEGHMRPVKCLVGVKDAADGVVSVFSGSLDGEIKVWQVSVSSFGSNCVL